MAYPTLRSNEVISALYNQIIGINTEASNIAGVYGKLLEAMRVEGSLYGDTKLVIETDVLSSKEWGADAEAGNLLALHRPPKPSTQEFVVDKFRQVAVTLDDYMTKRAFADEGSFSQFNSVVRGWVADTKKIYDATKFNTFIGTTVSPKASENLTVSAADAPSLGQAIAEKVANLMVELGDVSRDFNDLGFLRSYSEDDIIVVWNAAYVNHIKKIDLPALFHKEGLIDKFEQYVLPSRYFGTIGTAAVTSDGSTMRAVDERAIDADTHLFAGDLIPAGQSEVKNSYYVEDPKVICKIMCKGSVPFMSSFSVGTSFVNPKSLTENQYLTWSHNTLDYRKGKPFITIKEA